MSNAQVFSLEEIKSKIRERLGDVRYRIAVVSGKGGVGKSFLTAALAVALALKGKSVGVLDADFHGPSIPKALGVEGKVLSLGSDGYIVPVTGPKNVKVVSISFMLKDSSSPVIWRGPLKTRALLELLTRVNWGKLDYLLVDLPPGTGDEPLTIAQFLDYVGAIVVTIPSKLSKEVVGKAVKFCQILNIPVIGIVENMSEFVCPRCGAVYRIFGSDGESLAKEFGLEFLGSIPLDPRVVECMDEGVPILLKYPDAVVTKRLMEIADKVLQRVEGSR